MKIFTPGCTDRVETTENHTEFASIQMQIHAINETTLCTMVVAGLIINSKIY